MDVNVWNQSMGGNCWCRVFWCYRWITFVVLLKSSLGCCWFVARNFWVSSATDQVIWRKKEAFWVLVTSSEWGRKPEESKYWKQGKKGDRERWMARARKKNVPPDHRQLQESLVGTILHTHLSLVLSVLLRLLLSFCCIGNQGYELAPSMMHDDRFSSSREEHTVV
jgi:hypothetical protein